MFLEEVVVEVIAFSGKAKRCSRCADCLLRGERARFFVAWPLRGSRCVGMDSGMFSDIVDVCVVGRERLRWICARACGG